METTFTLLSAIALSLLASAAVLYFLSAPLHALLCRLCPEQAAANFWLAYTRIMLTLAPLLMVVLASLFSTPTGLADVLRMALLAIISGLLLALGRIGQRLGHFVPAMDDKTSESAT